MVAIEGHGAFVYERAEHGHGDDHDHGGIVVDGCGRGVDDDQDGIGGSGIDEGGQGALR